MIEIVEGGATHIASIMPIMEDAFDPAFGEAWSAAQCLSALAMPGARLLIATSGDAVCGFALSRWVLDSEELLMIGVARSKQKQAIGAMLLDEVVRLAKEEGRTQLFLEVRDGNDAQLFYSKSGFLPIGRRKQYYKGSDGFRPDAITMTLNL
ncbi:MAG TPA: ribosomal protein S18-alanine N-acetyltransferase [Sphingorhabdus sp.]|nr:ribosomal protein S18-alanine N-acetyltransferase [Sphingorhabdus sp.]